ncbi:hypothetical protein HYH03_003149 [Edaphochlamys debaryana]|uniref:Protein DETOXIFICATION n=1 Tax=Edaphochlamys debaryana TaxID=47281 RepID=A0A835Y9S1_9CHLO|nr:hypothetical protein HYH03_003149 [Edaphochlamys debaryana]|eukprot:KAG2498960.1 hypothetical protein HYH03_003149 [Edaphochlamys debaryana]
MAEETLDEVHVPLLAAKADVDDDLGGFGLRSYLQNVRECSKMFLPLLLNYICAYSINIVTLSFVGHIGKAELAAAALGTSLVSILGRTIIMGLSGGLDTLASQAFGAGNVAALGAHFRTAVAFLALHLVPLVTMLLAAPVFLREEASDADLGVMAGRYVAAVLPALGFECLSRPLNSVLVAQRITAPQATIQTITLPLHIANNYVLIHVLGLGYLGAAVASCVTGAYVLIMTSSYMIYTGMAKRLLQSDPLHESTWQALVSFGRLSYPACVMRCAESWGFSIMTVAAGKLPDPGTSVSAASISFNIYGILYMGFAAFALTTSTRVGNALGSGSARAARHAALSALLTAPLMWLGVATFLVEPHSQRWLALVFTDGTDAELMYHLRRMLVLVAALELCDGSQVVMTGVIQGAGKQKLGVLVNVVAFYVVAIPLALALAFPGGQGVEGMYMGMLTGPAIQAAAYCSIIMKLDWRAEARRARQRSAAWGARAPGAASTGLAPAPGLVPAAAGEGSGAAAAGSAVPGAVQAHVSVGVGAGAGAGAGGAVAK